MKSKPKVEKSKLKGGYDHVNHGFGPFVDESTKVLILGSFPSVKSREVSFYYGHPSNRFYAVFAGLFHCEVPKDLDSKKQLLVNHHIGLYDVIESCMIHGSSDASIKDVVLTDIDSLVLPQLKLIVLNGKTAGKYDHGRNDVKHVVLPSTSSANAAYRLEKLIEAWSLIQDYLD